MYGKIPSETLAELLLFIDEHEEFKSLKELGTVSRQDLSRALKDLAEKLHHEAVVSQENFNFSQLKELKKPYQEILSKLSPLEAKTLLKGFL